MAITPDFTMLHIACRGVECVKRYLYAFCIPHYLCVGLYFTPAITCGFCLSELMLDSGHTSSGIEVGTGV
jgi:hypothetical protein